ncbi:MAG: aminotransferase class V-fold PLP-dependent enzyme, partial [Bacteroidota bacterium]
MENNSRRNFIRNAALTSAAGISLPSFLQKAKAEEVIGKLKNFNHANVTDTVMDEEYWRTIRLAYSVSPSIINLNNGGVSPSPIIVQDMLDKYNRMACETPTYYMWRVMDMGREPLRENLASLAGVSPEEVAINRNASEALETIIFGLNLQAGDEVVLCKQDYPNMMHAWSQREKRDGIKLVWLDHILPVENDEYFTKIYADAITAKTKVVHLTHCINWCGQFIPVRKIA